MSQNNPNNLNRRSFLQLGVAGAMGAAFGSYNFPINALAAPPTARARSVIQIWMWGGPSHLDTFDPKPEAGRDYCGTLTKPIEAKSMGTRICELLPMLAKESDKFSLIRSMTHGIPAHETASYLVQTGRKPGERLVYPSLGAVVSLFKGTRAGYKGKVPPYIVLTQLQGRFSEVGFLDSHCRPFATGGDPAANPFVVEGIVSKGVSTERQHGRKKLLGELNGSGKVGGPIEESKKAGEEAYDMILGDAAKVFDLKSEKEPLRKRYGLNTFGQSCLMARRLVEEGVPYITINSQGWDTHKQHFQTMSRRLPQFDQGLSALLSDLSDRGLLDSTIVWCSGEFGRTPKVQWEPPWNGGRGHFGHAFSALVAGGGFNGGTVVGSTDKFGQEVTSRPVYPVDLIGSIYELLGIDPDGKLPNSRGLDVYVTPQKSDGIERAGRLHEIMKGFRP